MPSSKPEKGINDLNTKFPEIALQAEGWDPTTVIPGSHKKRLWKCEKGHTWEASPTKRTRRHQGCPICSNQKVLTGFNDLKTKFPEIALQAEGWDPTTVISGSDKKRLWKCEKGHTWEASPDKRTGKFKRDCPVCANREVLIGYNDLETLFPEIAKQADGWDPKTVVGKSNKEMRWKCEKCGYKWTSTIDNRTDKGKGCSLCAESGFNPDKPAWFYLMKRSGEQQLGITNFPKERTRRHMAEGWIAIEVTGPHSGQEVLETEDRLKKWLKKEIGLVPRKKENWYTTKMEVHSLAELKEKSGIETSIF